MASSHVLSIPASVSDGSQADDLRIRLKWVMLMRVALVSFLFGATILVSLRSPQPDVVSSYRFLYILIAYSYVFTLLSTLFFKYLRRTGLFSFIQIAGDILFITGIVQITGGIDSPFVFLYFLSIISGSILYYQKGALVAALLSTCSYLVLFYVNMHGWMAFSWNRPLPQAAPELYYRIFLNVFSFLIIAFLSNQLARRLIRAGEEIRQKEYSIENLQALNENIIQSVTSGLITTNLNGEITSANHSAEKILAIPRHEIVRLGLAQLFEHPEIHRYLESRPLPEEESSRFEIEHTTRNGEARTLGMTLSLLRDRSGERTGFLCTFQDLTRFKVMEEKIRRNEQLAMVGELAAGIAHEIRNPLASMSGSIQMLRSELDLSEENRRLMDIILKETDRLNNLVGNFLMYARPRPLDCRPTRIREVVEETLTLLRKNHRVGDSIRVETRIDQHAEALMDSMAIRQVFWNLAANAVEAMPQGGTLRVTAEHVGGARSGNSRKGAGFVRITFSDTGPGIDPECRRKLFFPFHSTKEKGSGLGLAIVHQIMQQHGGWVDVVNHPGSGAEFHLYLSEAAQPAAAKGA